ncbi:MAG: MBL fold metallo-hydrolase [Bacteroidales bacterium]|jgi:phosphoribosyl 1,2-cyclic phosphodiesterase|nr:MBL fold metallo-hydrolase [Bacteroidales bacterium]
MKLNFFSLSSGSSGNCYYLGNESNGILIDAGIPAGSIRKFLKSKDISIQSIMGVLVTHYHTDHIKGLELLSRKNNLPVFTTQKIWKSIVPRLHNISGITVREIGLQQKFQLAGFDIEAFSVSHDAPETIGFHIYADDLKVTIATDLGHICQTAAPYIEAANLLVIESNYDEKMLMTGNYPPFLKNRIMSDHGHLGNHQTSAFLADIVGENLRHICLAHLSNKNNTPEIALQTLLQTFAERGVSTNGQPQITILNRNMPSDVIRLTYEPS